MSKKIRLTIADPCHKNWEGMTHMEKGRYCAACQKQVIDFTGMNDRQLAAFFKKSSKSLQGGSVCGRFYSDQLDRDIDIPKKRIPWVRYFFQFALPAFLASTKATAQGNVISKLSANRQSSPVCSQLMEKAKSLMITTLIGDTVIMPVQRHHELIMSMNDKSRIGASGPVLIPTVNIRGIVLDEGGDAVQYASVMLKGTQKGVMADSLGRFELLDIPSMEAMILEVSSTGYEVKEHMVNKESFGNNIYVKLTRRVYDDVMVTAYARSIRLGGLMGAVSVISKDIKPVEQKSASPMIKVYPNPVLSGSSINVGCQKLKEGYYTIQLTNPLGQQFLNKETWIDGDVQVLNIDIPHVATGIYFLKLMNKETNKRFTQKIVVE